MSNSVLGAIAEIKRRREQQRLVQLTPKATRAMQLRARGRIEAYDNAIDILQTVTQP